MKYVLLLQGTQAHTESLDGLPPEDLRAHIAFMQELRADLIDSGELIDAQGLAGPAQARLVVAGGGGGPSVARAPFPEAKQFLAGYWLVDCDGLARAVELAARVSAAPGRGGAPLNLPIEVRPVMGTCGEEM